MVLEEKWENIQKLIKFDEDICFIENNILKTVTPLNIKEIKEKINYYNTQINDGYFISVSVNMMILLMKVKLN